MWLNGTRLPDPASVDRIADVLGLDVDLVLTLAGHRPATEALAPDDPRIELCAKVRRVKWTPERTETLNDVLDRWLRFDRAAKEKGNEG